MTMNLSLKFGTFLMSTIEVIKLKVCNTISHFMNFKITMFSGFWYQNAFNNWQLQQKLKRLKASNDHNF